MSEKGLKMVGSDPNNIAKPVNVDEFGNIKTVTEGSKVKIGQEQPINITAHPVGYLELEREIVHNDAKQQITNIGVDGIPYGFTNSRLFRTYDGYLTREEGETITNVGTGTVVQFTKTKYGYIVIREKSVWFSTSFESGYTKTLETDERGNFIGMNTFIYNKPEECVILLCEYLNVPIVEGKNRRVFLSMDGGQTFTVIHQLEPTIDPSFNHHYHTAIFDPYDRRIWVSIGDGSNGKLIYSDDLGENWHEVNAFFGGSHQQPTGIIAFPDKIAILPDRQTPPSILSYQKDIFYNVPNVSNLQLDYTYGILTHTIETGTLPYSFRPIAQKGIEAYFTVPGNGEGVGERNVPLVIVGTGDGGKTWHKLWTKSGGRQSRTGIVGPDKHGRLYCQWLSESPRVTYVFKKPKWQLSTIQNIKDDKVPKILSRKTLGSVGNRRYGENVKNTSEPLNDSIPVDFTGYKIKNIFINNNTEKETKAIRFYKAYKTSNGWFIDPTYVESESVSANSSKMFTYKSLNLSWLNDEDFDGLVVEVQYAAAGTGDFLIEFIGKQDGQ